MIPVKILEMVARKVGSEYGHDTSVVIQIYDDNGNLKEGDYVLDCFVNDSGTLFLTNKKPEPKHEESFNIEDFKNDIWTCAITEDKQ